MKALILGVMLGTLTFALPALAADPAANAPAAKATAPAYRMDPAKGVFHKKHTQKLKLGCDTCHDSSTSDILVVKAGAGPAPINRESCRSCHQAPGKPTWYGAAK